MKGRRKKREVSRLSVPRFACVGGRAGGCRVEGPGLGGVNHAGVGDRARSGERRPGAALLPLFAKATRSLSVEPGRPRGRASLDVEWGRGSDVPSALPQALSPS